jgi:hypothetical protein
MTPNGVAQGTGRTCDDFVLWKGIMVIADASWSIKAGAQVLLEHSQALPSRLRSRCRRVTRMHMVAADGSGATVFNDEVRSLSLITHKEGWRIRLELTSIEAFCNRPAGEELAIVLIELDDEEQPVNQRRAARTSSAAERMLGHRHFPAWLAHLADFGDVSRETSRQPRRWMLRSCGVAELTDLDWSADAEARFRRLEDDFYRWVQGLN